MSVAIKGVKERKVFVPMFPYFQDPCIAGLF